MLLLLFVSIPALAQQPDDEPDDDEEPVAAVAVAPRSFVRGYAFVDSTALAASRTFDAVLGTSQLTMTGGGGEVLGLWKGLFARVAYSSTRETGSRVAVFADDVIPLGIPVTVELRPLELAAGWRLPALAKRRIVPYAGGGLLRMGYRETSDFALAGENTNTTFTGGVAFGGIEVGVVTWVVVGVEAQYRAVPDALGGGGVSATFSERDLGGTTVRVLIGIRR